MNKLLSKYEELRNEAVDINYSIDVKEGYTEDSNKIAIATITYYAKDDDKPRIISAIGCHQDYALACVQAKALALADLLLQPINDLFDQTPPPTTPPTSVVPSNGINSTTEPKCEVCGAEITAWNGKPGSHWAEERKKRYGKAMCAKCVARSKKRS